MTPQSSFMILARIDPSREAELRGLLTSMNNGPGCVNVNNTLIPFGQFQTLHFARLLILADNTLDDIRLYGLPPRDYPLYLAFLGNLDGDADTFLAELVTCAPAGLRAIFSCCEGFTSTTALMGWMKSHACPSIATYVNWLGRTVRDVREEAALRDALEAYLRRNAAALAGLPPREIHATLRRFVESETAAGRLTLSPEGPTPLDWHLGNLLHLIGIPLLLTIAIILILKFPFILLLIVLILLVFIICLRHLEKTDPEFCPRVDQAYSDKLALGEDHDVTNQFSAMGSVKPGIIRFWTLVLVLVTVDYAARHIFIRGRLARIRTIHFARWVPLDGYKRLIFCSDYDGSFESYMDDFINKAGFGLNASFSNGIGYPTTNWLLKDGCADELKYKEFLRRHTMPTQVWYKAYPGLTAVDLERNSRIRQGLESTSLSHQETCDWIALL